MSRDLVRRTDLMREASAAPQTESELTEVDEATHGLAEAILFGTPKRPEPAGPPRIMLALDCTTSMGEFIEARKISLVTARAITNGLFAKAPGLQVQLMFFRGDDQFKQQPRQFRVSDKWYGTPEELARAIAAIEHWPGWTQHCRLLRHAVAEAEQQQVQELLIISDAFEGHTPLRPVTTSPLLAFMASGCAISGPRLSSPIRARSAGDARSIGLG
jgi:hypothetical protein